MANILSNWAFFALLAPLLWAIANFCEKYSLVKYTKNANEFIFFSSLVGWPLFGALVLIFGLPKLAPLCLVPISLGMLYVLAYWFFSIALRTSETSQLIISFKAIPVLTLIFANLLFSQVISLSDLIAFAIVLIGTMCVSIEKPIESLRMSQGVKWIAPAILIWGFVFACVDWTLTRFTFWNYLSLEVLGSCIAGTSFLFISPTRKQLLDSVKSASPGKYFWFAATKTIDFFGQVLIKKAFVLGPSAALVTVVMQIQSIYGIAIGALITLWLPRILEEDISIENLSKKIIGTLIAFVGIALLFLK